MRKDLKGKCQAIESRLDQSRGKLDSQAERIIQEQMALISTAETGIEKINSDLEELRKSLKPWAGSSPKPFNSVYEQMKETYSRRLQERRSLEKAKAIAEESITASRLHRIPGVSDE